MSGSDIVFGPVELPSGREVTLRLPSGQDRREVLEGLVRTLPSEVGNDRLVFLMFDALCRQCLCSDGGRDPDPDQRFRWDSWDGADIEAFSNTFRGLTEADPGAAEKFRALGKSLRGG